MPLFRPRQLRQIDTVSGFCCGQDKLDVWIKDRALTVQRAGKTVVYVMCDNASAVMGYYSLSTFLVGITRSKTLTSSEPVPMALIGRMGVHKDLQRQGIGKDLLIDALRRITATMRSTDVQGVAVRVVDSSSRLFYYKHGFRPSYIDENLLIVSMIEVLMAAGGRRQRR